MLTHVRHQLDLSFERPISEAVFELRMTPRIDSNQALREFELSIEPSAKVGEHLDWQGNRVHHFSLNGSHRRVTIATFSSIDVQPRQSRRDGERDALATSILDHRVQNFLLPHGAVQHDARIGQFADRIGLSASLGGFRAAAVVVNRLPEIITFIADVQDASCDTIRTILDRGYGNATDIAHVALALLRSVGFPARFVSGYSFRYGPSKPRIHAWVEVLIPSDGWVGVDPALGQIVGESYVALAAGRGFDEARTYRGIYRGGCVPHVEETLVRRILQSDAPEWSFKMSQTGERFSEMTAHQRPPSTESIEQQILQS
jgi:transglutaminase-like putative cysteine protease